MVVMTGYTQIRLQLLSLYHLLVVMVMQLAVHRLVRPVGDAAVVAIYPPPFHIPSLRLPPPILHVQIVGN